MPAASTKGFQKFFLGIVLPSILAIILFIISIYLVIIPAFEKNSMERKKEMISELVHTAWSLLREYDHEAKSGVITLEEAQQLAAAKIEQMRYGEGSKDYFWITDQQPVMVMHPYRKELNGTDLSSYADPQGKKLFMEAVKLVEGAGEGYIHYMWQWKDDTTRIVPKLSYVKGFAEWGWIVGTGIYLEDVQDEMAALKGRLLRISLLITVVIIFTLLYVIRQSLLIENKRKAAENKLKLSREKYKTLVEASTEGTLMVEGDNIIFSNLRFSKMMGCKATDVLSMTFDDLFELKWQQVVTQFDDPQKTLTLETRLKSKKEADREVVISVSKIKHAQKEGFIVVVKDMSRQVKMEKQAGQLSDELQTSLLLMNQPIKHFVSDYFICQLETPIAEAARIMTRKNRKVIFVKQGEQLIGVVNDKDFRSRAIAGRMDSTQPVSEIMSAPVVSIQEGALLYEAVLRFNREQVSHLAVKNAAGEMIGVISHEDVLEMQQNSLSYLIREIEQAEDVQQIKQIYDKVPVLVNALLESGDKAQNITRIITSVSDAISECVISLTIESIGMPPCKFAFMAMGSEGRMEQTLFTDQDNAIIFDDVPEEQLEEVKDYFARLAAIVNKNLDFVGFNYCKGDIMAQNPQWSQPLSVWKKYFSGWITNSDPQSILDTTIFFDFRCIYGEPAFTAGLKEHVNRVAENKAVFFYHMAQSVIKIKLPVNLFGNIKSEHAPGGDDTIDIKKILLPVVGFVRTYAIKNRVQETSTPARIQKLYADKIISKAQFDELILSYNYLMMLRFRFQSRQLLNNIQPNNQVDVSRLTEIELTTLKRIFTEIGHLQTQLGFDFKGGV